MPHAVLDAPISLVQRCQSGLLHAGRSLVPRVRHQLVWQSLREAAQAAEDREYPIGQRIDHLVAQVTNPGLIVGRGPDEVLFPATPLDQGNERLALWDRPFEAAIEHPVPVAE